MPRPAAQPVLPAAVMPAMDIRPAGGGAGRGAAIVAALAALALAPMGVAEASPAPYGMIAGATAPLIAQVQASAPQQPQQQQESQQGQSQQPQQQQEPQQRQRQQQPSQEQPQRPPPVVDPAGGPVFSIMGGSVFSGSSSFQAGAAFAYFFGAKANVGFEVEGTATFGPGGRVSQAMASFVLQAGARTSKFVPYVALGAGYLQANTNLPDATRDVLDSLGIRPEPISERAPLIQFGGGVRFYVKPNLSFRGDVRFAQVLLDIEAESFSDRLFPMRRLAGMVSWDF